jgi:hypothetical protein
MRHNPSFGIMGHFVIQAVIVVLLAVKGGGSGHPDYVILGGVISSESSVMNRTELRAIDHSCGSFERLGSILTGGNGWRRDALRLVDIENIGPANERNP